MKKIKHALTWSLLIAFLSAHVSAQVIPVPDEGGIFSISSTSVIEGEPPPAFPPAILTVTRSEHSAGFVSMEYQSLDGTAESPNDYDPVQGSLSWADGDSTPRIIQIPIKADGIKEGMEYFTVELIPVVSESSIFFENRVGTVTIRDPIPIPTLNQWAIILLILLISRIGLLKIAAIRTEGETK